MIHDHLRLEIRVGKGYPPKTINKNHIGVNFPKFSFRPSLGKMFLQIDQHKIENRAIKPIQILKRSVTALAKLQKDGNLVVTKLA